eukprot:8635355-Pyramimonas_sp.AAC.1
MDAPSSSARYFSSSLQILSTALRGASLRFVRPRSPQGVLQIVKARVGPGPSVAKQKQLLARMRQRILPTRQLRCDAAAGTFLISERAASRCLDKLCIPPGTSWP